MTPGISDSPGVKTRTHREKGSASTGFPSGSSAATKDCTGFLLTTWWSVDSLFAKKLSVTSAKCYIFLVKSRDLKV